MGGRGNAGANTTTQTPKKSLEELKAERKQLSDEYQDFIKTHLNDGYTENEKDIETLFKMQTKLDSVEYDIYKQLSPTVKQENWKGGKITDLTREEAAIARQDMLKNKDMYMAISSAAHGTATEGSTTSNTALDTLYNNNPNRAYKTFEATRKMLNKKYGDTITLYRVPTAQTAKATVNMTSTKYNAEQYAKLYGGRVQSFKVPVKDVLAVNVARSGGYEEFIILNKKRK